MKNSIVVMGVAGCGKSSLGLVLATAEAAPLVEGDSFHSPQSREKMSAGIPLTDADRQGWLGALGEQLRTSPQALVLTCSSLKRRYREQLRGASPGLRFVFLEISRDDAVARVAARGPSHFFSADLVASQFLALESPVGEQGVLRLDARLPLEQLQRSTSAWLQSDISKER